MEKAEAWEPTLEGDRYKYYSQNKERKNAFCLGKRKNNSNSIMLTGVGVGVGIGVGAGVGNGEGRGVGA
eukprot:1392005-Amorphochlora_amoeboformis.AAC.1